MHVGVENTGSPYMLLVLPVDRRTGFAAILRSPRKSSFSDLATSSAGPDEHVLIWISL